MCLVSLSVVSIRLVVIVKFRCRLFVVKMVVMVEVLVMRFRLCDSVSRFEMMLCWLVGILVMIVVLLVVWKSV